MSIPTASDTGSTWREQTFQAMLFHVSEMRFAAPLIHLQGVVPDLTKLEVGWSFKRQSDDSKLQVAVLYRVDHQLGETDNLGISYADKSRLNMNGDWQDEIERRLQLDENRDKQVVVDFSRKNGEIRYVIRDEGTGFDWEDYMEMSPERAFDTHGRGIALARSLSFNSIEFRGNGNEVCAIVTREVP